MRRGFVIHGPQEEGQCLLWGGGGRLQEGQSTEGEGKSGLSIGREGQKPRFVQRRQKKGGSGVPGGSISLPGC